MSTHHKILGVPINASKLQIKKAYFKKAKVLHPDVNKSPDAEEEFVRLNMAYEALTNPKYTHPPIFTRQKSHKSKEQLKREWLKKRNEELRARARRNARKKQKLAYEESRAFLNSYFFNIINLLFSVFFILPAGIAFIDVHFHPGNKPVIEGTLFIGICLIVTSMILFFIFLNFVYRKLFG